MRLADPHGDCAQPWHADSGAIADERGYWVCNSVWMLDDFTPENGATRMLPGIASLAQAAAARILRIACRASNWC